MPSPMCAVACADPVYRQALKDIGFSTTQSVTYGGRTYSHDDIAAMVDESYQRHRGEFSMICGSKPRVEAHRQRQFKNAVMRDVGSNFGISWYTFLFAGILGILGGPLGLVVAVATVFFEYYLSKDLHLDQAMLAAMGAA